MNTQYPVHVQTYGSSGWLLAAVLVIAFLSLAFSLRLDIGIPDLATAPPAASSASQPVPEIMPVPTPPQNQTAQSPQISATPVPAGLQPQPVLQPVPRPPAGE